MSSNFTNTCLNCRAWLWLLLLLLVCGDIEANPGPPRRSLAAKAPSADEKIESLSNAFGTQEAKVSGLETELDHHRKAYDEKIKSIETRLSDIVQDLTLLKSGGGEGFENFKDAIAQRIEAVDTKINEINESLVVFKEESQARTEATEDQLRSLEVMLSDLKTVSDGNISEILNESRYLRDSYGGIEQKVKEIKVESSGKLQSLMTTTRDQRREYKAKFVDMDVEFQRMKDRMEMLSNILDDMHERMYEFEQSKKNNLIFYGVKSKAHENPDSLKQQIVNLLKDNLNIRREIPVLKTNRVYTGPEVRGVRPVLVTFETFKDRETVLRQAKALKKAHIDVSEDFSKRTRENRQELRKFMRKVKRANPEKNCFLEYDRLYIDHKIYVYSEALGQVIEQNEAQRYADSSLYSRPGTQMMMAGFGGSGHVDHDRYMMASRPPSGMSGRIVDRAPKSASAIPRLPPLNRAISMSTGAVHHIDPRDEKLEEMERMVASYQERLDTVTNTYQEKVNILEGKLVDRDMEHDSHHRSMSNQSSPRHHPNGVVHYSQDYMSDVETDGEDEPASPVHPISQDAKVIESIPEEDHDEEETGDKREDREDHEKEVKISNQVGVVET